uniref:Clathrin_bdg domain-containing protein n=1 Tax=Macrostomum lignano TaxID=282301 RepID=A0A1I8GLN1_9PLAT
DLPDPDTDAAAAAAVDASSLAPAPPHGPLPPMRPVVKSDSQVNVGFNVAASVATADSTETAAAVTYSNPLVDEDDLGNEFNIGGPAAGATSEPGLLDTDVASAEAAEIPDTLFDLGTTSETCEASTEVSRAQDEPSPTPPLQQQQKQQPLSVADYFADLQMGGGAEGAGFLDGAAEPGSTTGESEADMFTDSIRSGEAERRMDAWLPSEATRQLLDGVVAGKVDPAK